MLVEERKKWRKSMEEGNLPLMPVLNAYRDNRESESWRSSKTAEIMCEYILFLEEELEKAKNVKK